MRTILLPLCVLSLTWTASSAEVPLRGSARIEIPNSKGGFDYLQVDDRSRRLLLDHTGNGTLDIIDLNTEKVLKQIATGAAQGVAVDGKNHRYFVSVSKQQKLVIIDSAALEVTGEVPLKGPGDAIAYDSDRDRVYVGHDDATHLWVIDPGAKKVEAAVEIAEGPEYIIYDGENRKVFLNIKSDDTLLAVDATKPAVTAKWPTLPAKHPHGLAYDPPTKRLFVAGTNGKLAILNAADGKVLSSVDMVNGVDQIAFDPAEKRLYCPSSSGQMTVMSVTDTSVSRQGDVATAKGAKTVAFDPTTHAVWVAYAEGGKCFAQKFTAGQ